MGTSTGTSNFMGSNSGLTTAEQSELDQLLQTAVATNNTGVTTPTWPTIQAPATAAQNTGIAASTVASGTAPTGTTGPAPNANMGGLGGVTPSTPSFNSVNFQGKKMAAGGIAGRMTLPPLSAISHRTPMHAPSIMGGRKMADGGIPTGSEADPWWTRQQDRGMDYNGGLFHAGTAGRTDTIDANVPAGSHVIPADVVSGLGEGNTLAGSAVLDRMFHTGPGGMKLDTQKGRYGGPRPPAPYNENRAYAEGGRVPIVAAGGEYLVHPDAVKRIGGGDINKGHAILHHFSKIVRAKTAKKLKSLPPPKR